MSLRSLTLAGVLACAPLAAMPGSGATKTAVPESALCQLSWSGNASTGAKAPLAMLSLQALEGLEDPYVASFGASRLTAFRLLGGATLHLETPAGTREFDSADPASSLGPLSELLQQDAQGWLGLAGLIEQVTKRLAVEQSSSQPRAAVVAGLKTALADFEALVDAARSKAPRSRTFTGSLSQSPQAEPAEEKAVVNLKPKM